MRRSLWPTLVIPILAFFSSSLLLLFIRLGLESGTRTVTPPGNVGTCNLAVGTWKLDPSRHAMYDQDCPFHRKSWNCLKNGRPGMDRMYAWSWTAEDCNSPRIDSASFLEKVRNRNIGLVGDSLNENFLVAFACILRTADIAARKWKRKGAWRGAFFPAYNVTVGYHRAVLLAQYTELQQSASPEAASGSASKGFRVDVDVPARSWIDVITFYDVLIFSTGHWWSVDKFPDEKPLVFFQDDLPLVPPLNMTAGLELVVRNMVSYVEQAAPDSTLRLWRTQSPRHFHGGEWNQNGSCTSDELLDSNQVELWFDPENRGVNREAREVNRIIRGIVDGTSFKVLDVVPMSEYRQDGHPALWVGKKNSHLKWGQDCLHWCLPGIPDIWVDYAAAAVLEHLALLGPL